MGGERGNKKDQENFWLFIHSAHKGKDEHHLSVEFLARHRSSPLATSLPLPLMSVSTCTIGALLLFQSPSQ